LRLRQREVAVDRSRRRHEILDQRFGGIDSNITAAYLKQSGFNATVEDGLKSDPARIVFTNCSVPTRPSN